jgi:hypothetical protein
MIRADETPHVAWLRTALSEMRDRSWVGSTGQRYDGTEMISLLWDKAIRDSVLLRRHDGLQLAMREVEHATAGRADADDLIEEMLSLGNIVREADGTVVDPTGNAIIG